MGEVPGPVSVVTALYLRTKTLHIEAERSGIIRDLLRGNASREGYILFLRNLLPAYQAMEEGLRHHRHSSGLAMLANYKFDRATAIESDLAALYGNDWESDLPLLPAGTAYASRVGQAAHGDGARLIAHAYTRYLGDLSGGLILQRLLAQSLGLQPAQLSFYQFPGHRDPATLKDAYREALDEAGASVTDPHDVIEEGAIAFSLNIDLSCAVQAAMERITSAAE